MCSKCDYQLKNSDLEYEPAVFYLWLKCPKCNSLNFHLLTERGKK